jgi:hypothetical protein
MLGLLTLVVMGIVAYAFWREGLFTAVTMTCNVVLAGVVTFGFFEPIADQLQPMFKDTFLAGYEDFLCLLLLFCGVLGGLRTGTNALAPSWLEYEAVLQKVGASLFGLIAGYLVAGFLVCALQTLPWQKHFLGFDPRVNPEGPGAKLRRVMPPDRVWLGMMHLASRNGFSWEDTLFDSDGSFELRYYRERRIGKEK